MGTTKQGLRDLNAMGRTGQNGRESQAALQRVQQRLCEHVWRCAGADDVCRICGLHDACVHPDDRGN